MGQKTHPVGFRIGITKTWDSNWFDEKGFSGKLQEDLMVRNYVRNRLKKAGISRIQIDRTPKRAVITIHTSRPGIVIGKSGKEIAQLEEELKKVTSKEVKILIHEIKRPELDSSLVAENIASQIEASHHGCHANGGRRYPRDVRRASGRSRDRPPRAV